jgi:hypothetical protein
MNKYSLCVMNYDSQQEGDNMPRGDRSGPNGLGPKTGRAIGFCAGYNAPGYTNPGVGRGQAYGRSFGRGLGMRRRVYWDEPIVQRETAYKEPTRNEQLEELKAEKTELEKAIKELEKE